MKDRQTGELFIDGKMVRKIIVLPKKMVNLIVA